MLSGAGGTDAAGGDDAPGSVPKYEQVRTLLAKEIASLDAHSLLPSERELVDRYGVSRMTVRQAISGLVKSGDLYRVQGSGTYVAEHTISKNLELTGFTEDMRARGLRASSLVLKAEETTAGARVGQELQVSPGERVFHLQRLRLADGHPMCLETVHLPVRLTPNLLDLPLDGSLYDALAEHYGIQLAEAEQTIRPSVVDADEAALLTVPALSPGLLVHRIGRDVRGRIIERAVSLYRGDRYDIRFTVRRDLS